MPIPAYSLVAVSIGLLFGGERSPLFAPATPKSPSSLS